MRLPFFLLSPTQNSQDLEKNAFSRHPKANEACGDPKSYQPISLLYVPYKILERLIYIRFEPLIDLLLPKEQAGSRLKIPKIWRRAVMVAIPKRMKPVGEPKSYRPISLLFVPYKILERLIYARVEPLIDPLLPKEQAGFRRGKSTVDQVVLLTQNIEDSFEAKKKAGAVFVNLTAAYDTV